MQPVRRRRVIQSEQFSYPRMSQSLKLSEQMRGNEVTQDAQTDGQTRTMRNTYNRSVTTDNRTFVDMCKITYLTYLHVLFPNNTTLNCIHNEFVQLLFTLETHDHISKTLRTYHLKSRSQCQVFSTNSSHCKDVSMSWITDSLYCIRTETTWPAKSIWR